MVDDTKHSWKKLLQMDHFQKELFSPSMGWVMHKKGEFTVGILNLPSHVMLGIRGGEEPGNYCDISWNNKTAYLAM